MSKKLTSEIIIKRFKLVHENKYDYSKVVFTKVLDKVIIICKTHGEFLQTPSDHYNNRGCKQCGIDSTKNKQLLTTNEFIKKSKNIYGNKFNYSLTQYNGSHNFVKIICNIHGEFSITPSNHYSGNGGCYECGRIKTIKATTTTKEYFIEKSKKIYGNKYDYSKVKYINSTKKVIIICPVHGEFNQKPTEHCNGRGCKQCGIDSSKNKRRKDLKKLLLEFKKKHGNKYDYSKVEYVNDCSKITIICPVHGEFKQVAGSHLSGSGCNDCGNIIAGNKSRYSQSKFIEISKQKHNNKYDYSLVKYYKNTDKLIIICPIHGKFNQLASSHMAGKGCEYCNTLGNVSEPKLFTFILDLNNKILKQGKPIWLNRQRIDIFIPDYNIGIEYQGTQHFKPVSRFGGLKGHLECVERDERKRLLCEANGCKLFYFTYTAKDVPADYPHKVYTDEQELKQAIEDYIKLKSLN